MQSPSTKRMHRICASTSSKQEVFPEKVSGAKQMSVSVLIAAGDSRNQFVFGSSTPRTLAHLDKIPQKQRVYDAKIPKKSATHSDFKAAPIRFNARSCCNQSF